MNRILITGGDGFIGSNLVQYMVEKYPDYKFIVMDNLTYAGDFQNISEVKDAKNFIFVEGNICDRELV